MNPLTIALASVGTIFGGALLGMWLQNLLPGHHLSKEMQDLVKLSAGTIATLTALILGLLVSSAKSEFDAINTDLVQGSANFILLDRTLARYGPEAKEARDQLKRAVQAGIEMVWPNEKTTRNVLSAIEDANAMELFQNKLNELSPQTDSQRQARTQALQIAANLGQLRWLMIEQAQNQLPTPLLLILIFWLILLFVSFGLFAPHNSTARTVLFVGACAISAAIFLVLELNRPFDGVTKVSSAPLRAALRHMGQ